MLIMAPHPCQLCHTNSLKTTGAVCESCLRKGLRAHHQLLQRYHASLHNSRLKAAQHLQSSGASARQLRACIGHKTNNLALARRELERKRYACLKLRERLATRTSLDERRDNLRHAMSLCSSPSYPKQDDNDPFVATPSLVQPNTSVGQDLLRLKSEWLAVASELTRARQSACFQAIDMWHLQTTDTAGPLFFDPALERATLQKQKQDELYVICQVGGCIFPPVKDLKLYPPDEITAAVGNTAYLVRLLAMYLGVRLPFALSLGPKSSIKAAPFTIWQERYPNSQPLFISASAVKQAAESSSLTSSKPTFSASSTSAEPSAGNTTTTTSTSGTTTTTPAYKALSPFVTALSMLTYNIYFLSCSALRLPLTPQLQEAGPLHVLLTAIDHFVAPHGAPSEHDAVDLTGAGAEAVTATEKELSKRSRTHASAYRPLAELNLVIGGVPPAAVAVAAAASPAVSASTATESTLNGPHPGPSGNSTNNASGGGGLVFNFNDLLDSNLAMLSKVTQPHVASSSKKSQQIAISRTEAAQPHSRSSASRGGSGSKLSSVARPEQPRVSQGDESEEWDLV